jgi:hypothetical protein
MRRTTPMLVVAVAIASLGASPADTSALAERYVKLVLAVGEHDASFVDAYYGPPQWKAAADAAGKRPLEQLRADADALVDALRATTVPANELEALRREYLTKQTSAAATRLRMLGGEHFTFDEESKALYDATAPTFPESHFTQVLARLETLVPGRGPLPARVEAFRQRFVIPRDKLDAVFRAAVAGCREQTVQHLTLPPEERFEIEYVTGKSWSGYNWYKGQYRSLIQVNTDLPIFIDRAIDLACHEGYPGHHVYNVLHEQHLVNERGWREFSVYPLFSPQSLIAEGTANFGIEVAFPGEARVAFERERLFPLAGLDPKQAQQYYDVLHVLDGLSYAGNEAARHYLNGEITATQAADWLVRYTLSSRERAEQRVRFFDQYRSYVINYNLGKDLVRQHVERRGGTANHPDERWRAFGALLSSPRPPSGL